MIALIIAHQHFPKSKVWDTGRLVHCRFSRIQSGEKKGQSTVSLPVVLLKTGDFSEADLVLLDVGEARDAKWTGDTEGKLSQPHSGQVAELR
jgi:hypothetical protein